MNEMLRHVLERIPARLAESLSQEEHESVTLLAGLPAFHLLVGLLKSEQELYKVMLVTAPLGDEVSRHSAAVTQGRAQGIARILETLLELLSPQVPTQEGNYNG